MVNFELPNVAEDYVHRIGRTGRAGASGHAISLVCAEEGKELAGIERLIRQTLERQTIAGFEPSEALVSGKGTSPRGGGGQRSDKPSGGGQRRGGDARKSGSGKQGGNDNPAARERNGGENRPSRRRGGRGRGNGTQGA